MSDYYTNLAELLKGQLGSSLLSASVAHGELTIEVPARQLLATCRTLRDNPHFAFEQLIDLCGVDYLEYGNGAHKGPRFSVVYHLLSVNRNHRLRLRTFLEGQLPQVDSVNSIWNSANWYEREAFDLYGIVFNGHPDLRRILTDYGFIGHPFRKDFPLSGNVEMRYDPQKGRVVYEPVTVEPRTMVPRVIRADHRYNEAGE